MNAEGEIGEVVDIKSCCTVVSPDETTAREASGVLVWFSAVLRLWSKRCGGSAQVSSPSSKSHRP